MRLAESLRKVQASQDLLGHEFYEVFLEKHPEARPFFNGVDMWRQGVLLTAQLGMIEAFARHSPAAANYLQVLGTRHSDKGVPKELYPKFRDTMLEVLAKFHGDGWDEDLADAWRDAIDRATEKMFEGYDKRFRV